MDSIIWNIAAVLSPLILLTFFCHQGGEKIRKSKFLPWRTVGLPWRTVGLSLVGIGWLGYSLLAFLALIDIVAPLSAWAWSTFVR
jgi:hypothetical protein